MTYILIPAGEPGETPARRVDVHVHCADVVSDALGGALPVPLKLGWRPLAVHLRDDCRSAGLARNPTASVLTSLILGMPHPVVGPAVFTSMLREETGASPAPGIGLGMIWCLPGEVADNLMQMADDVSAALTGGPISTHPDWPDNLTLRYRASIHVMQEKIDATELWPDYPYPATVGRDRLAEGLSRHGIHVSREPWKD